MVKCLPVLPVVAGCSIHTRDLSSNLGKGLVFSQCLQDVILRTKLLSSLSRVRILTWLGFDFFFLTLKSTNDPLHNYILKD